MQLKTLVKTSDHIFNIYTRHNTAAYLRSSRQLLPHKMLDIQVQYRHCERGVLKFEQRRWQLTILRAYD